MKPHALLVALALALLAGRLSADTITLNDGTVIDNVKIASESFEKVEYRKPKVPAVQSVKTGDIRSIEYGQTSADFREGLNQIKEGNVQAASRYFVTVAEESGNAATLRALARLEAGDALLAIGQLDLAVEQYDLLLKDFPDTRHLAPALLGKGRALFYAGKLDEAGAAFARLKADAASKSLGDRWALEAEYNGLLVLEAQKKTDEAAKGFEALRAKVGTAHKGIANQCALALGRIYFGGQKLDEALPLFESIIDARLESESEVAAAAYNGRGRVLFEQGQAALTRSQAAAAKGDKTKAASEREDALASFGAARLDFLRVYTSYPEVVAQQPEAMYWAAQCFLNIGDADAEIRANTLLARCKQKYPESTWGKRAAAKG